jgi:glycosyltransferase involved in cell wall biosynthesis
MGGENKMTEMVNPKKILVVVIAKNYKAVVKKCLGAIERQNYPNFSVMISLMKPKEFDKDKGKNWWKNINYHRNYARKMALASDVDYFMFVDSDIILPKNALSMLMLQVGEKKTTIPFLMPDGKRVESGTSIPSKHIMGGWYPLHEIGWNAGRWVADHTLCGITKPEHSVTCVNKIDMGCLLVSRKVFEQVDWEDNFTIDILNPDKTKRHPCGCLMFCRKAEELGYKIWINGDVICKHIIRLEELPRRLWIKLKIKGGFYVAKYRRWFACRKTKPIGGKVCGV